MFPVTQKIDKHTFTDDIPLYNTLKGLRENTKLLLENRHG